MRNEDDSGWKGGWGIIMRVLSSAARRSSFFSSYSFLSSFFSSSCFINLHGPLHCIAVQCFKLICPLCHCGLVFDDCFLEYSVLGTWYTHSILYLVHAVLGTWWRIKFLVSVHWRSLDSHSSTCSSSFNARVCLFRRRAPKSLPLSLGFSALSASDGLCSIVQSIYPNSCAFSEYVAAAAAEVDFEKRRLIVREKVVLQD